MSEQFKIDTNNEPDPKWFQELEIKKIEIGWLGKFFGSGENASIYIAGSIVFAFMIATIYCVFIDEKNIRVEKFWDIAVSMMSLSLGYIFGKKS